jgi:hypothetical protein
MVVFDKDRELAINVDIQNFEKIKHYVEQGANVNIISNGSPIIHKVLFEPNFKIVKYLLTNGADPLLLSFFKENFFQTIHRYSRVNKDVRDFKKIITYISNYDFQKLLITRNPKTYAALYKSEYINNKIKKEYNYLLTGNDFNLL